MNRFLKNDAKSRAPPPQKTQKNDPEKSSEDSGKFSFLIIHAILISLLHFDPSEDANVQGVPRDAR